MSLLHLFIRLPGLTGVPMQAHERRLLAGGASVSGQARGAGGHRSPLNPTQVMKPRQKIAWVHLGAVENS